MEERAKLHDTTNSELSREVTTIQERHENKLPQVHNIESDELYHSSLLDEHDSHV